MCILPGKGISPGLSSHSQYPASSFSHYSSSLYSQSHPLKKVTPTLHYIYLFTGRYINSCLIKITLHMSQPARVEIERPPLSFSLIGWENVSWYLQHVTWCGRGSDKAPDWMISSP